MKKVALSAFACDPTKGSEPGNGWNWAIGLADRGYEVHCFTRIIGEVNISQTPQPPNLIFHYIRLPLFAERLYHSSTAGMYLYYLLWQWFAYRKANKIHKQKPFDVAHHVTWGSVQMGSFMYKLGIRFIFGPAGGGQVAPEPFKKYFGKHWADEIRREKITRLMLAYNPACKAMLRQAHAVLVSNPDTTKMVQSVGVNNVYTSLDAALPQYFFSDKVEKVIQESGKLKLLWVGRFLPRKGIGLILDVMKTLKDHPEISLTVVGDGEMRDEFLAAIERYQLADTVFWKGKVPFEEVTHYYQTHDVLFLTSLRDSGPVQLVEAMAFSMPVVTLNLHGQAFIINEETGVRIPCTHPEEAIGKFKIAILDLLHQPELVVKKGKAAFNFAIGQTWENKIDSIIKKYY